MNAVTAVSDPSTAELVLHPIRRRILKEAREPISASEAARRMGETRQKVNYHVNELAAAGLLEPAGEVRKGNLIEHRYVASARSYVLAPGLLEDLAPRMEEFQDRFSAGTLMALAGRLQEELGQATREASEQGRRMATLSLDAEIRFRSAEEQGEFAEALSQAVLSVVSWFASRGGERRGQGSEEVEEPEASDQERAGRPYRVMVGCYPIPPSVEDVPVSGPDEEEEGA